MTPNPPSSAALHVPDMTLSSIITPVARQSAEDLRAHVALHLRKSGFESNPFEDVTSESERVRYTPEWVTTPSPNVIGLDQDRSAHITGRAGSGLTAKRYRYERDLMLGSKRLDHASFKKTGDLLIVPFYPRAHTLRMGRSGSPDTARIIKDLRAAIAKSALANRIERLSLNETAPAQIESDEAQFFSRLLDHHANEGSVDWRDYQSLYARNTQGLNAFKQELGFGLTRVPLSERGREFWRSVIKTPVKAPPSTVREEPMESAFRQLRYACENILSEKLRFSRIVIMIDGIDGFVRHFPEGGAIDTLRDLWNAFNSPTSSNQSGIIVQLYYSDKSDTLSKCLPKPPQERYHVTWDTHALQQMLTKRIIRSHGHKTAIEKPALDIVQTLIADSGRTIQEMIQPRDSEELPTPRQLLNRLNAALTEAAKRTPALKH
jgi:hypothetical protein